MNDLKNRVKQYNDSGYDDRSHQTSQTIFDLGVLLTLGILALFMRGCNFTIGGDNLSSRVLSASEIVSDTNQYLGKSITLQVQPIQNINSTSFTATDAGLSAGEPVLIVNGSGREFSLPVNRNTPVQVTGEVRTLISPEIKRQYNLNLSSQDYEQYNNKPIVIAHHLALAPEISQVAENPRQYYGQRVVVTGQVENMYAPGVFNLVGENWFGNKQEVLVVLRNNPRVPINSGQSITTIGEVKAFSLSDVERNSNLPVDANLKRQLATDYANKPVLVSEVVYP